MKKDELKLYKKLLLECEKGRIYIDKFYQYKETIIPQKIYRYRSCNDDNFNALYENKLWLTKPENYNDVYDCSFNHDRILQAHYTVFNEQNTNFLSSNELKLLRNIEFNIEKGFTKKQIEYILSKKKYTIMYEKLKKYFYNKYAYTVYDFLKQITTEDWYKKYYRNNTEEQKKIPCSILCFSENYNDILMWSHYADNNKGFCLEFDANKINTRKLYPIMYEKEPPCLPDLYDKCQKGLVDITFLQNIYVTTKYKNWSYEKELRYVDSKEYIEIVPTAIYMGTNIDIVNERKLKSYAESNNVQIKKMVQIPIQYKLEAREILSKDD